MLVKIAKYVGFCLYRRSYLPVLRFPVVRTGASVHVSRHGHYKPVPQGGALFYGWIGPVHGLEGGWMGGSVG